MLQRSCLLALGKAAGSVQVLGHSDSLAYEPWPALNEEYLISDSFKLPIQVRALPRLLQVVPPLSQPHRTSLFLGDAYSAHHCGSVAQKLQSQECPMNNITAREKQL